MSPISNVKSIKFIYVFVKTSWRKYLLICYLYFYSYTPWVRIFIDSDWAQVIETLSFRCWEVKMKSSIQQNPCRYAEIPECFIFISLWRALLFIQDLYVTWHYYDTKIRIYLNVLTIIKLINMWKNNIHVYRLYYVFTKARNRYTTDIYFMYIFFIFCFK